MKISASSISSMPLGTSKSGQGLIKSFYVDAAVDAVLADLATSNNGLSMIEVEKRRVQSGFNEIITKKKNPAWKKLLKQFTSPLILILILCGGLSIVFGGKIDAIIIFTMIAMSVLLDFFQEHKANEAAESLQAKIVNRVQVRRAGKVVEVLGRELVAGDIVLLSAGSMVPADCRLITTDDFFVNESILTGEAFPVAKDIAPDKLDKDDFLHAKNLVFLGSNVASGYGEAVVVNTGKQTVFGQMTHDLAETDEKTDFEKGITRFSYLIADTIFALVIIIFLLNLATKGATVDNLINALLFSLALAVGLTPEMLPMVMSITMARGSVNMARHGVIVKKLNSIHDFGGMDVLCTDKTGTLTENSIRLIKHIDLDGNESEPVLDYAFLNSSLQSGIANPLDEAIVAMNLQDKLKDYRKIDEIPFDFSRRRLSIVVERAGKRLLITKGAPEEMMSVCKFYDEAGVAKNLDQAAIDKVNKIYHDLSADGFRVLALAYRAVEAKENYEVDSESDLILFGLVAFLDPAKAEAKTAIDQLEAQGIEVKVITGDNDLVTSKICRELDVKIKGVLTGLQIEKMTDYDLALACEKTTIFSRVSPEQKARIVRLLKNNGHTVGYIGDGINDTLPLKTADVGISVNNAVDVAKETADLILLTKDLGVLSLGVTEGRKTFGNTIKYILMGLSSNFGNMFSMAVASFLLPFLPMLPIQILLNNFLYDVSQMTIPLDNVDVEYTTKPKKWDIKLIKHFMLTFGPISSVFDIATFVIMLLIFHAAAPEFQTAWFLESIATQSLVIFIIRTRKIPFIESRPSKWLVLSVVSFVALAMIIPFTVVGQFFHFTPLSAAVILAIWGLVIVYLIVTELAKRWIYKRYLQA